MKPPTEDALRYAATVLGREVTQLERLIENVPAGTGGPGSFDRATREQCELLLSHVRSVRTWILGVRMPIAQRREARTGPQCETWIHDSSEDESHGPECRCSECGAAPIMPSDLNARLLRTGFKLAQGVLGAELLCTCAARGIHPPGTCSTCPLGKIGGAR